MSIVELFVLLFTLFMLGWTIYNLPVLIVGVREVYRRRGKDDDILEDSVDHPFFSIIVPMKDEEKVAGRILRALTKVEYPPDKYEILIIEDASSDKTSDICHTMRNTGNEPLAGIAFKI